MCANTSKPLHQSTFIKLKGSQMKNNSTRRLVYLSVSGNNNLLESAITDVSIAARIIGGIDNLNDLSFGDLENISRNLQLAISRLEYIKESTGEIK
jgi:hypothetical protein